MTIGNDKWLEVIAAAADLRARTERYDEWSATYDADMLEIGYVNSSIAAALVGRYVPASGARLLDAGAGTGALGELLTVLGYDDLVALDMSSGMLARARERGVYRDLHQGTLGEPLDFADGAFTAVTAMGVLAFGAAPAQTLDELLRVTRSGGYVIFNVAQSPWEDGGFKERAGALEAARRWTPVEIVGPYRPMPRSVARAEFMTRGFVYRAS